MKRINISYILLAALMMLASCSQENVISEAQTDASLKEGEIYIDVDLPVFKDDNMKNSRVSYEDAKLMFTWEEGDELLICSDAVPEGETFTYVEKIDKKARFKGKVPQTDKDKFLYCYYKAAKLNVKDDYKSHAITYPEAEESMGTVSASAPTAHLKSHLLISGETTAENLKSNGVNLSLKNAIMRFDLKSLHPDIKYNDKMQVSWSIPDTGKKIALTIGDAEVLAANSSLFFAFDPETMNVAKDKDLSLIFEQGPLSTIVSASPTLSTNYQAGYRYYINVTAESDNGNAMCKWTKFPAVGDFLMADGTFVKSTDTEKLNSGTPIGIVYNTDPARIGAKAKELGFTHGSVMALKNAVVGETMSFQWKKANTDDRLSKIENLGLCYKDVNGYYNTDKIFKTKVSGKFTWEVVYPAFNAVKLFSPFAEGITLTSTGWYLPAIGEWYDILKNLGNVDMQKEFENKPTYADGSISNASFDAATAINKMMKAEENSTTVDKFNVTKSQPLWFWSSSEYSTEAARLMYFNYNGSLVVNCLNKAHTNSNSRVRCVLAF